MISEINTIKTDTVSLNLDHFDLNNDAAYLAWREKKLSLYPIKTQNLVVKLGNFAVITDNEREQIVQLCSKYNMAVYQCDDENIKSSDIRQFAANFDLHRLDHHLCTEEDGVSELMISDDGPKEEFIPYTDRAIGWHTDGYYNQDDNRVYSLILHCARPAIEGGINALLDHEMVYIMLRDKNSDYIRALSATDCMTIPGYSKRPESKGPVFLIHPSSGKLHMRYTARKRNIIWKDDQLTKDAIACMTEFFSAEDSPIFYHKLETGQGLIANNVLHTRTSFIDSPENRRLLYRARFLDRITETYSE